MKKELLKGLTDEQIAKLEACNNSEEILALAKKEGVQLTDEQLEAVSGGCGSKPKKNKCFKCGGTDITITNVEYGENNRVHVFYTCPKCGPYDGFGWENQFDLP